MAEPDNRNARGQGAVSSCKPAHSSDRESPGATSSAADRVRLDSENRGGAEGHVRVHSTGWPRAGKRGSLGPVPCLQCE
jgi:hypothetical protein